MRRFIAYLALSAAGILGIGAAIAPTALKMDTDLAFGDGQTLYFRASEYDADSDNGNYGFGAEHEFLTYQEGLSKQPIEYLAETVRARLDDWGIAGYNVNLEGTDTLAVSLRTPKENAEQIEYLKRLLTFSGGDYDLDAQNTDKEGYSHPDTLSTIIDGQTAEIVDIEQQGYKVPVVIIPLKEGNDYKTDFLNLVSYCEPKESSESSKEEEKDTGIPLQIWANRMEGDTYAASESDPNVASRIIFSTSAQNAVYYATSDTEKETPYLQIIPYSAATSGETYDPTKTQEAYDAARFMKTLFNSSTFEYDALKSGNEKIKYNLTYVYSQPTKASVENLINLGDWNSSLALSKTLIAYLVAFAFLCFGLALFERSLSLIPILTTLATGFASFACFVAFGAQFNIAAMIALPLASLVGLFGSLFYSSRLREELYKGRTPKKAHAEACKRALLPTADAGVIAILLGVCLYGLGGDVANKAGLLLVLGGFFGMIASFLFTRILGWLVCNDSTVASSYYGYLNVKKDRIPNLLKEEKQTYFGPYADRDFTKGKKWVSLVSVLFLLAGIGSMIGWGIAKNGTFFNTTVQESTVLRIEVRSSAQGSIDIPALSDTGKILDLSYESGEPTDVFHHYKINGKTLADLTSEVLLSDSPKTVYEGEGKAGASYYWYYYTANLNQNLAPLKDGAPVTYNIEVYENGQYVVSQAITTLSDLAADIIDTFSPSGGLANGYNAAKSDLVYVAFENVVPEPLTPYFHQVALGLGIGLASSLVYLCLRYRPSRGAAIGILVSGASFISVSFFALTRISSLPSVSLGSIFVAFTGLLLGLFILAGEKEFVKDSKEKDKRSLEFRSNALIQANSRQAGNVFLFALLAWYIAISLFAFGPFVYATSHLNAILGVAFALALALCVFPPLANLNAKALSHISFAPSPKKLARKSKAPKKGGQLMKKKASAEPEEAIFIGIND